MTETIRPPPTTSPARYNFVAQLLHWLMAAILIYLILFSSFEEVSDAEMVSRIKLHAGLGILVVVLALVRWFWRRTRPRPAAITNSPRWQIRAAEAVHYAFYALFLIAPAIGLVLAGLVAYDVSVFGIFSISGWITDSVGAADTVNSFHGFSADVLLALIVAHVAAALYHHFVKHDGLVWRMLPFRHPVPRQRP